MGVLFSCRRSDTFFFWRGFAWKAEEKDQMSRLMCLWAFVRPGINIHPEWWSRLKERVHAHPRPPPNVVWAVASQKHPRCMLGAFKPVHLWRNRSEGMLIPALNRALVITMGTDSMLLTTSFKCDKILKYSTESKRDRYFWQWSWNWPSAPEQLNKESSASSFDQSVLKQCKFSLS